MDKSPPTETSCVKFAVGRVTIPVKVGDSTSAFIANWLANVVVNDESTWDNAEDNWLIAVRVCADATFENSLILFSTYFVVAIWSVVVAFVANVGAVGTPVNTGDCNEAKPWFFT